MDFCWKDNQKAWELEPDQTYAKVKGKGAAFNMHNHLVKLYGA